MQNLDATVESIAREIGLDAQEIALRKVFLQFTSQDVARLSEIHDQLAQQSLNFAASFYEHLLSFEPLRPLLPDQQTLGRPVPAGEVEKLLREGRCLPQPVGKRRVSRTGT